MNCSVCEERIDFDEMKQDFNGAIQDFNEPVEMQLTKNGDVTGTIVNGRNYCVKCWALK